MPINDNLIENIKIEPILQNLMEMLPSAFKNSKQQTRFMDVSTCILAIFKSLHHKHFFKHLSRLTLKISGFLKDSDESVRIKTRHTLLEWIKTIQN